MTAVYIIGGIIALFFVILINRVYITISYEGGDVPLNVAVRYTFIKLTLTPKKEKKLKLRNYTYKKTQRKKKPGKAAAEKTAKKEVKTKESAVEDDKKSALGSISQIRDLVLELVRMFFEHLRIDIKRINIRVGCRDAAVTAITYGIVTQAVGGLLAVLDCVTKVRRKMEAEVVITPDFCNPKIEADICLRFSISIMGAIALLVKLVIYKLTSKSK